MSFDEKNSERRKNAVRFLKQVPPCTSCGKRGHWQGDPECPNFKKGAGKNNNHAKKKSLSPQKKKPATNLFVLHEALEDHATTSETYVTEHSDEKVGPVSLDSNKPHVQDNPKTGSLGRVCRARLFNLAEFEGDGFTNIH